MKCNICGTAEATVHLTEIVNGEMNKMHLCEECAKKKGAEMEEHFGLSDLLAGLADLDMKVKPKDEARVSCPNCGLTYQDFKKIGRLGCGQCYTTFENLLTPLLKRVHGAVQHAGKAPSGIPKIAKTVDQLQKLRSQLHRAIDMEEFEEAVKIRDKIRALEGKNKK